MKKYILLPLIALLLLSCDTEFLDRYATTEISSGSMWTTESLTEAGMAGIYSALYKSDLSRTQIRSSDYDGLNRTGIEGSGFSSIIYQTNYPLQYLALSSKKASDYQVVLEWPVLYTVIHACNDAIENMQESVVGTSTYQRYLCEARLLRAFIYMRLNMLYGGVPVYLEQISNEECTEPATPFNDVWRMIIDECTFAIENENCPDNTLTSNYGRPSKGMAYAIRGISYMWLAANLGEKTAYDGDEVETFTDAEVTEFYTLAAADFEAVGGCGYSMWTGDWGEQFLTENEKNADIIFPLQFNSDSGYTSNWQKVIGTRCQYAGWQNLMPNPDWVDSFQWNDGTDFEWTQIFPDWELLDVEQREVFFLRDSLDNVDDKIAEYDALISATSDSDEKSSLTTERKKYATLQTAKAEAIDIISQDVYDTYYLNIGNEARVRSAYDDRDPRLDASVITPYECVTCYSPTYNTADVVPRVPRWPMKEYDYYSLYEEDYVWWTADTFMYVWEKHNIMDDSLEGGSNGRERCDADWPLIRYTHIYLMLAEAYVHIGEYAKAKAIVDEVRARVDMPEITLGTEKQMLEAVRYEIRVELAEEGVNFFDEIRWGTYYDTKFQGADINGGKNVWGDTQYNYLWYYVDTMWPWSIPLSEIQMNSNLKERDGWIY